MLPMQKALMLASFSAVLGGGGGGGSATVTWNAADQGGPFAFTLSNGNKTAALINTGGGGTMNIRGTPSVTSGKKSIFVQIDTVGDCHIGVADSTYSLTASPGTAHSVVMDKFGNVDPGGLVGAGYANTNIIGLHIDFSASKLWFDVNGVMTSGDPVAGTGGYSLSGLSGSIYLLFCGASANTQVTIVTGTPPSGFSLL